jgi:hypothetical protein
LRVRLLGLFLSLGLCFFLRFLGCFFRLHFGFGGLFLELDVTIARLLLDRAVGGLRCALLLGSSVPYCILGAHSDVAVTILGFRGELLVPAVGVGIRLVGATVIGCLVVGERGVIIVILHLGAGDVVGAVGCRMWRGRESLGMGRVGRGRRGERWRWREWRSLG